MRLLFGFHALNRRNFRFLIYRPERMLDTAITLCKRGQETETF
jgi:hypothetical protein